MTYLENDLNWQIGGFKGKSVILTFLLWIMKNMHIWDSLEQLEMKINGKWLRVEFLTKLEILEKTGESLKNLDVLVYERKSKVVREVENSYD